MHISLSKNALSASTHYFIYGCLTNITIISNGKQYITVELVLSKIIFLKTTFLKFFKIIFKFFILNTLNVEFKNTVVLFFFDKKKFFKTNLFKFLNEK